MDSIRVSTATRAMTVIADYLVMQELEKCIPAPGLAKHYREGLARHEKAVLDTFERIVKSSFARLKEDLKRDIEQGRAGDGRAGKA